MCNNVPVKITNNCYSASRHLRRSHGKFTIWVNAVCVSLCIAQSPVTTNSDIRRYHHRFVLIKTTYKRNRNRFLLWVISTRRQRRSMSGSVMKPLGLTGPWLIWPLTISRKTSSQWNKAIWVPVFMRCYSFMCGLDAVESSLRFLMEVRNPFASQLCVASFYHFANNSSTG
jgi:hypothetical protein